MFSDALSYNQVEDLKRPVAFTVLKKGALTDGLNYPKFQLSAFTIQFTFHLYHCA